MGEGEGRGGGEGELTWIFLRRSNGDDLLPEGEAASPLLGEPGASLGADVRSTSSCLGDGITAPLRAGAPPDLEHARLLHTLASCWRSWEEGTDAADVGSGGQLGDGSSVRPTHLTNE